MNKITVGLDCDGVLYDFVGAAAEWSGFKKENATDWDIFKAWGAPGLWKAFDIHAASPGFCLNLKLLHSWQTIEFVEELNHMCDLVIVTSPYRNAPTWAHEREKAIYRNFGLDRDRIISARSKQYARIDVLVDDRPKNIEDFPDQGIIFDQPWNQNCTAGIRCKGYSEVIQTIRGLSAG